MVNMVGLIPARDGSKRLPGKNRKLLAGHPLIAYTIRAAIDSGVFSEVLVCSENAAIMDIALHYGAHVSFPRPMPYAADDSPDIEWLSWLFATGQISESVDSFAILRPTSPFRTKDTIRRAFQEFSAHAHECDSIRAVEPARQHPFKMWLLDWICAPLLHPVAAFLENADCVDTTTDRDHVFSRPTQTLLKVYVQNASLEMAHARVVTQMHSISGDNVLPFFTTDYEGFDINTIEDWLLGETLIDEGMATLPGINSDGNS